MKKMFLLIVVLALPAFAQDGKLRFYCSVTVANMPIPSPFGPPVVESFAVYGGRWKTDGHPVNCGPDSFRYTTGPVLNQSAPYDYSGDSDFGPGGSVWFQSTQIQYGLCKTYPYCKFHGEWIYFSIRKIIDTPNTFHYQYAGRAAVTYADGTHDRVHACATYLHSSIESPYAFVPPDGPSTLVMGSWELVILRPKQTC